MLWTPDPLIEDARKLPDWAAFHRECSRAGFCWDIPNRDRHKGPIIAVAFHPKRTHHGGYECFEIARGVHKTVLAAIKQAHDLCGRANDTTTSLLQRMMAPARCPAYDPLAEMLGDTPETDPLEGMFG